MISMDLEIKYHHRYYTLEQNTTRNGNNKCEILYTLLVSSIVCTIYWDHRTLFQSYFQMEVVILLVCLHASFFSSFLLLDICPSLMPTKSPNHRIRLAMMNYLFTLKYILHVVIISNFPLTSVTYWTIDFLLIHFFKMSTFFYFNFVYDETSFILIFLEQNFGANNLKNGFERQILHYNSTIYFQGDFISDLQTGTLVQKVVHRFKFVTLSSWSSLSMCHYGQF